MPIDVRTRVDGDAAPTDPSWFFEAGLPAALECTRQLRARSLGRLRLKPLALCCGGLAWTLEQENDVRIRAGVSPGALRWELDPDALDALVSDQTTPIGLYASGALGLATSELPSLLDWWLVLRSALDKQPIYTPGAVTFVDRDGKPLDLHRTFLPSDDLTEMRHFLGEAGFLHIAGLFTADEMAQISVEMDRNQPSYSDGDKQSWCVTTADRQRRLVRMQHFDTRSPPTAALLADERLAWLATLSGDGHQQAAESNNRIEALIKPLGVVEGISDVPWHKDCSLGRCSYECSSLTVGISVTGADQASGQLRVVAGSHRALLWPARLVPGHHDLPEIDLPTDAGDITLHASCTLHMAEPPLERERRVLYTSLRLPDRAPEAAAAARNRLRAVRERAPLTVSQPPSRVTLPRIRRA